MWKLEGGSKEVQKLLYMNPIENLKLKETQRLQLLQANKWDNARSERISLCGELEMRNKLFQESRTKDRQAIEECEGVAVKRVPELDKQN